jgi:tRNA A37 methylthiotransferase MiaB
MNELLKKISTENNQKEIWLTRTMIVNEIQGSTVFGYTDNMKQICANCSKKVELWEIVPVKIIGGGEFKLEGEIIL